MTTPFDNVSMVAVFRQSYGSRSKDYMRMSFKVRDDIAKGRIPEENAAAELLTRLRPLDEAVMKEIYTDLLRKIKMHGVDLSPIRDLMFESDIIV